MKLQPRDQKILRVWNGNPNAKRSKIACGIFTNKSEIARMQSQGWSVKSSSPIPHYRINQTEYYYDCLGTEVVMER